MSNTVRLHRVIRTSPDVLYRAFLEADALCKWLPPHGFTCTVHEMDVRVGGRYRMSFTQFSNGQQHSFGGEYLELEPGETIRHTDIFEDTGLPGTMVTTISLAPVSCGTELHIVQEGIPEAIPVEHCYLGWQESLQLLALLVEAKVGE
ncbi:SRPBCC family protein [Pokkaliibacter sp. MBI-7]|uniref:SRPBCC family protein n=1 Tax=Pokkaliibacter sp. MBI-7 TaxID=3040600 RepID=UPI00244ADCC8|nr:SRPBCC family protein [Pokkaliibacter sp. MBI-7]MDH2436316.1 SRPBCC family protein [Pokkaliibacter sp. MBI-7]